MQYATPGIYIEEERSLGTAIRQIPTAIPAFIGYTEIAKRKEIDDLLNKVVRITSFDEYKKLYTRNGEVKRDFSISITADDSNEPVEDSIRLQESPYRMYDTVELFYANGGGTCYIISVGLIPVSLLSTMPALDALNRNGGLKYAALEDEITLLVFPDAEGLDINNYYSLYRDALTQCANLKDRFTIIDVKRHDADENINSFLMEDSVNNPIKILRDTTMAIPEVEEPIAGIGTENLHYGAAYWPWLKTGETYELDENKVTVTFPDESKKTLEAAGDDAPEIFTEELITKYLTTIKRNLSLSIDVPPSSAVAGTCAYVDRTKGVWNAPANIVLNSVIGPALRISDEAQVTMNVHYTGKSVNAIRSFTGKGTVVWGARTLAGNDTEWRYIAVRRFCTMVEISVKKAIEPYVFEPNDTGTWTSVRGILRNYLSNLHRDGALTGATDEQAFYVRVGLGTTMTPEDILNGEMIVEIGLAVVRPAEFIVLKFFHKMQQ